MSRPILRFNGAVRRDAAVEAWLAARPGELGDIARRWYGRLRECGDDVVELMHDGAPTVCVGDAALAYVNAFRDHVNMDFFHGASLPDPAGLLEGTGRFMRHVKLWPGVTPDARALEALIDSAYRDIQQRKGES